MARYWEWLSEGRPTRNSSPQGGAAFHQADPTGHRIKALGGLAGMAPLLSGCLQAASVDELSLDDLPGLLAHVPGLPMA